MQPRLFRLFVLGLALALSVLLSWLVGLLVRMPLFAADAESMLFLVWVVCIPVIYAVMRFYGLKLGLPVAVVLGLGAAALWARRLGDVDPVFVTLPVSLALVCIVFESFWGAPRVTIVRNLMFGMVAALANTLSGLLGDTIAGNAITGPGFLQDFRLGLLAALSVSVALTLAERIYFPLAWRWNIEELFEAEDEETVETNYEETL